MNRYGRRPMEEASKSSHSYVINDEEVKQYLEACNMPKTADEVAINPKYLHDIEYPERNAIENIIAIDGGYQNVAVKKTFPSSTIAFFQFGALMLNVKDLDNLSNEPFISPEAMAKMKELQRTKLVIPTKNISLKRSRTLTKSVRKTLHEFFNKKTNGDSMNESLKWFLFQEFDQVEDNYQLASCPVCRESRIKVKRKEIDEKDYTFTCTECKGKIYLTDVFRLHEAIDDEIGAGGILGYLTSLVEQFIIIHTIRSIIKIQPALLKKLLFIKDGPLAFFGQTANMHAPMRDLCNFLSKKYDLYMVGLEKSGTFVEHADEISEKLNPGQVLLLSNEHIYKYILPGDPETEDPYARTSYYSSKLIFKSRDERMYVMTIPTADEEVVLNPRLNDFKNLATILLNIEKLKCDMYDNALLPVALVNKLVSLSNHPSSVLLEKFAKNSISTT